MVIQQTSDYDNNRVDNVSMVIQQTSDYDNNRVGKVYM